MPERSHAKFDQSIRHISHRFHREKIILSFVLFKNDPLDEPSLIQRGHTRGGLVENDPSWHLLNSKLEVFF